MAETPKTHCPNCGHELSPEYRLNGQDGAVPPTSKPRAVIVLSGIVCVLVVVVVVLIMPTPTVFTEGSKRIAKNCQAQVMSSVASSYFGIETTGDASDTVDRVQKAQQSKTAGGSSMDTI